MYVSHLECAKCSATYDSGQRLQLCECGKPLLVRYDLEKIRVNFRKEALATRQANMWRYWEMLPIKREENVVCLGEGMRKGHEKRGTTLNIQISQVFSW